jgi:dTDP-4-amino-4,6-dideoxygalactose transaminase
MAIKTKVSYVNLAAQHRALKAELLEAAGAVIESGHFILGPAVAEFEKKFAALCGAKYAVGVANGTDALVLALRALGVGPGDEVITSANSFVASATCSALIGAKPVLVDVRSDYNIDPAAVEKAITKKTKAIMPVHLTGRAADMTALLEISKRSGVPLVEDAAQAVGTEHAGKRVGSLGKIGCFSLHPLKNLAALGDAGIITTDDESLRDQFLVMRNLGLATRENCVVWSGNSRLDTLQAAMLLAKLRHLDAWTEGRRRNAAWYRKNLAGIKGVKVPDAEKPGDRAVYHTFIIEAERRDALKAFLAEGGVETAIHYPLPIHLQKAAEPLGWRSGSFPESERQAARILSLPVYPELTENELGAVAERIREFYQ